MQMLFRIRDRISEQFLFIVVFATAFAVIGYYAPILFARTQTYYTLSQPVSVDRKIYNPCDTAILSTKRTALASFQMRSVTQLVRISGNEDTQNIFKAGAIVREAAVDEGVRLVSTSMQIPCDTQPGQYFFVANYFYRVEGVDKSYTSITEQFTVIDEPVQKVQ